MHANASDGFGFRPRFTPPPDPSTKLPLKNEPPPMSSIASSQNPPEGSISTTTKTIYRLPNGEPIVKHLENLLREQGVVDANGNIDISRIESVQCDYRNKDGTYSPDSRNTQADIYIADTYPIFGKEAFCFEMQWTIKVKDLDEPVKMRNTLFTNITVPKLADPMRYERAKTRAKSVAFTCGTLISSAMDPHHQNYADSSTLLDNLRTSPKIKMSFGTESERNFRKKTYLNAPLITFGGTSLVSSRGFPFLSKRSYDDAIVKVFVGEKENQQKLELNLSRMVNVDKTARRVFSEAQKMKNTKVSTGPARLLDEMRRMEELDREEIARLDKQRIDELGLNEKNMERFARDREEQGSYQFERLVAEFRPTTNSPIDKLTAKLQECIDNNGVIPENEWKEIAQEVARYDSGLEQMRGLNNEISRDILLLQKLNDDFNLKIPVWNKGRYTKALNENPREIAAMDQKVEALKNVFFRFEARRNP